MKKCHSPAPQGALRPYDKVTQAKTPMETLSNDILALLDALEADLDVDLDFDADEDLEDDA
jgi:hypothetical protein